MKFRVVMKDPDTLYDAIHEAVAQDVALLRGLSDREREPIAEMRREEAVGIAGKWFKYGEYLTIEIDTDAQTATVIAEGD
jgi:hypothetical protein